jgi:ankyrin repeat protein
MTRCASYAAAVLVLTAVFASLPAPAQTTESPDAELAGILRRGGKWTAAHVRSVDRLLREGASIRTRGPQGVTVLMFGANVGGAELMRKAFKGGVDVNAQTQGGLTALWYAMSSRNEERVRLLLDAGAEVDPVDSYGRTPLMMATNFKFRAAINLLLARGANPNARNKKGYTALAYTDGHPGITRLLREKGVKE